MKLDGNTITGTSLPTYESNALAIAGGLSVGDLYKTSTGEVKVVV